MAGERIQDEQPGTGEGASDVADDEQRSHPPTLTALVADLHGQTYGGLDGPTSLTRVVDAAAHRLGYKPGPVVLRGHESTVPGGVSLDPRRPETSAFGTCHGHRRKKWKTLTPASVWPRIGGFATVLPPNRNGVTPLARRASTLLACRRSRAGATRPC